VEELAHQPALADARLAVHRDEVRAAVAKRTRPRVVQELELLLPADEGRADHERAELALGRADDFPDGDRTRKPTKLELVLRVHPEPPPREVVGNRADQDLAGCG